MKQFRIFSNLLILIMLTFSFIYSTDKSKTSDQELLKLMGVSKYPDSKELEKCKLPMNLLTVVPVSTCQTVDNNHDLAWLKPIIQKKKVFMMGEEHYYKFTNTLKGRLFFLLNQWDNYPLLIQENQFSISAFIDHYISIKDDRKAEDFYQKVIYEMIGTKEDLNLYKKIRQWNKKHPNKQLHVGFTDVEHDYMTTLKKIILPYFKKVDSKFNIDFESFTFWSFEDLFKKFKPLLKKAAHRNIIGQYPFITPKYIRCVITNLISTFNAHRYNFNYYRQKAIVRNLTDPDFFGKYFTDSKVMIHGGGYHTVNNFPYPDSGNFYREGNYLQFDFLPTKGKTFSMMVWGMAYSINKEMAEKDLKKTLHSGREYRRNIGTLQKAYKKNLIKIDEFVLLNYNLDDYDRLLFKYAHKFNYQPLLIKNYNWKKLLKLARDDSKDFYRTIVDTRDTAGRYDAVIYVPCSPIVTVIDKK